MSFLVLIPCSTLNMAVNLHSKCDLYTKASVSILDTHSGEQIILYLMKGNIKISNKYAALQWLCIPSRVCYSCFTLDRISSWIDCDPDQDIVLLKMNKWKKKCKHEVNHHIIHLPVCVIMEVGSGLMLLNCSCYMTW